MTENHGADYYRQRAEDMRRQADRAVSLHLRETYLRIADNWDQMAEEALVKDSQQSQPGILGSGS